MKMSTLQSLASRNRNYIARMENCYIGAISIARHWKLEESISEVGVYLAAHNATKAYDTAARFRKEITKLAAIQKDIKAEIKFTVEMERYIQLSEYFSLEN